MEESNNNGTSCTCCGSKDADLCINPYVADIQGIEVYEYLCAECYNAMVGDI